MGIFQKMFRKKEVKWIDYKADMKSLMTEQHQEEWFQKLLLSVIEKEEQQRSYEEMVTYLKTWTDDGRISKKFEDTLLLREIIQNHSDWVKEMAQFHYEVRQGRKPDPMDDFIYDLGEPFSTISNVELRHTYFALWGEVVNVVSQVM